MSLIILKSADGTSNGLSGIAIIGLFVVIAALYFYSKKNATKKDR